MSDEAVTATGAKVINLNSKRPSTRSSEQKWGKPVMDRGYSIIPSMLLRAQSRIGLSAIQLAFILHLIDHWWEKERNPYPSRKTLGDRMNISERQLSRVIKELHDAGLVTRIAQSKPGLGQTSNQYDMSGLVKKMQALEPEFREADEARRTVSRRGGLKKAAAAGPPAK